MSVIEREQTPVEIQAPTKRDMLHRAADLLEEFGWCQGRWADCGRADVHEDNRAFVVEKERGQAFCMVGARIQASRDLGLEFDEIAKTYTGEIEWNDYPNRTREEVIARLRKEAESA